MLALHQQKKKVDISKPELYVTQHYMQKKLKENL